MKHEKLSTKNEIKRKKKKIENKGKRKKNACHTRGRQRRAGMRTWAGNAGGARTSGGKARGQACAGKHSAGGWVPSNWTPRFPGRHASVASSLESGGPRHSDASAARCLWAGRSDGRDRDLTPVCIPVEYVSDAGPFYAAGV